MGGVPNASGPSPTLGSLGPSHQWHHKSRASLRGPPCAHGVAGTPQGEVRDRQGLLMVDEELDYWTAKEMAGYRITPDPDSRPDIDKDEPTPTPTPSPRPGPSRTPNRRRKSTYRVPSGSPPVRSRGPSSPVPPEPQPRAQQPAAQREILPEWVDKPFADVAKGIRQAWMQ